jgi:hypothetical protein
MVNWRIGPLAFGLKRACYSSGFATPGANKADPNPGVLNVILFLCVPLRLIHDLIFIKVEHSTSAAHAVSAGRFDYRNVVATGGESP